MPSKKSPSTYLQIFAVFILLMTLPQSASHWAQGSTVAIIAPALEQIQSIKRAFTHLSDIEIQKDDGSVAYARDEIQRLELENQSLANEVHRLKQIVGNEGQLLLEKEEMFKDVADPLEVVANLRRRDLLQLMNMKLRSVPAQVIFRSPATWNSSLWINAGSQVNEDLGREVIAKNSPVVVGTAVVGVIDYVGKKQSRVRLITDSGLTPSVRVMRFDNGKVWYLAKGELRGSTRPLWRTHAHLLKGIGFNYDFPDNEGPARDLRTGEPIGGDKDNYSTLPLILPGDLLITTGMDGVFPAGLKVGKVSQINLLKEGDYYYEIEAAPSAKDLDDLSVVYVLPSLGYDTKDQPPPLGR